LQPTILKIKNCSGEGAYPSQHPSIGKFKNPKNTCLSFNGCVPSVSKMKKGKINLLILLALIGLGISSYLTIRHFQLLTQGLHSPSFCSISEKIDCDSVMMSRFATLGPFPVGGLGLIYFFYLLLTLLYARIASDVIKPVLALPFISSLPALVVCLYLATISTFVLKTWCILCISLYVLLFCTFLLLRSIMEVPFLKIGNFLANYAKAIMGRENHLGFSPGFFGNALYALVIAAIGLYILYGNQEKYASYLEDFDHQAFLDFHYLQKPVSLNTQGHPMWGKAGAPVTIIEFSDFECPFCKMAALNLKPHLKEHQDDIQFFFFNYPLNKDCNPNMQRVLHQHACDAAKAVICANEQGKFWPYHDLLFLNQPKFSKEQLLSYAKTAGLDTNNLEGCMNSEETKNKLLADTEAGKTAGVEGTPTILVNGRLFKEWLNPVMLNLVIEEELKKSQKK
jgi:protein-disulfide isomerase/uncharacterized membrane protein